MKLRQVGLVGVTLALINCSPAAPPEDIEQAISAVSKHAVQQQFIGTWEMETGGAYVLKPDGSKSVTLGPRGEGRLIVTKDRRWLAFFQNPDRPNCAGPQQADCTSDEINPGIWRGSIFYSAVLELAPGSNQETGRALLDIDFSMWPNEVNTQGYRDYRFLDRDHLRLTRESALVPGALVTLDMVRVSGGS